MNIKAYIESGVIESYVLGMADAQEAAELEQLSRLYPEIRKAMDDFEALLEKTAMADARPAPAGVKERLFASLSHEFAAETQVGTTAKVIAMQPPSPWLKYVAVASVILLAGSAAMNIYFYHQFRSVKNDYLALLLNQRNLVASNNSIQAKALDLYQGMQLMSDPAMVRVPMPGVKGRENSLATVFWDSKSKDVYLLANKLPQTTEDKQYQLWALVDGKPVDAGVLNDCNGLCKLKNIQKAQGFAITLEKKGGSPTPTMAQLFVLGNVST
ncbi:MAG: hypothetical protein NVSMB63_00030 [Sediminibacterium sp.]